MAKFAAIFLFLSFCKPDWSMFKKGCVKTFFNFPLIKLLKKWLGGICVLSYDFKNYFLILFRHCGLKEQPTQLNLHCLEFCDGLKSRKLKVFKYLQ